MPARYDGLDLATHAHVYEPAEDSFLLAECVAERGPARRALDVGTGTGIVALVAARQGARVVATDANPHASRLARANAAANGLRVEVVRTDLAAAVRGAFDLVTFNPPYLPHDPDAVVEGELERALTGGATGAETTRRLVADLPRLLAPDGEAIVLTSTRGAEEDVLADARALGLAAEALGEERFFFERLTAWRLRRTRSGP